MMARPGSVCPASWWFFCEGGIRLSRMSTTLQVGSEAPALTLTTPDGGVWRLGEHLPVALFFFRGMW
jgi:hypothetical protein